MGYTWENYCVGCPQGCINCGRREDIKVWYCDNCEDPAGEDNPLYLFEGEELCESCLLERLISKECDDCDDTRCCACDCEAETMYLIDGGWHCKKCALEHFEKVYLED